MTEPELLAVEAEIHEDTPYFFQRIGEVTFESHHAGTDAHNTARRWQRECIATAPDHGVVAAAGDNGMTKDRKRMCIVLRSQAKYMWVQSGRGACS